MMLKLNKISKFPTMVAKPILISILLLGTCLGQNLTEIHTRKVTDSTESAIGCGYRNVGGIGFQINETDGEADFGEFPWMLAIKRDEVVLDKVSSNFICGGSLITPQVALTAAHCVREGKAKDFKVRAGEWEINSDTEIYAHQDRQVVDVIVHEHFNNGSMHNDVALLFLEPPFDLAPNVNTVCLPQASENFEMLRCFATGWGNDQFENGKHQNYMKKIELPVVPNAECEESLKNTRLGKFFKLHSSLMCAGGEPGKDTCKGDGGSPLVCPMKNNPNQYLQAGIVSWGIGCGKGNLPGVYANVANLRSWIDEQLANKKIDSEYFTP